MPASTLAWRAALIGAALASLAGCRTASGPPAPTPEQAGSSAGSAASVASSASAVASAAPLPASRRDTGCWGLTLPEGADARLSLLGTRCAEGMTPLLAPARVALADETTELALPALSAGACVRAAAVAAGGVTLVLVDGDGVELARDGDPAAAVVPSGGPACPRAGAKLRVVRKPGVTAAWVGAWATRKPE